jgi:ABC-type transport system involved in cytochrome c biogenesis permease subunit
VVFAAMAGLNEFFGGLLLTVGLLTPLGAAMALVTMIVGMISVHLKNGFFAASNGIEMPFLYAAAALGLVFTGAGTYSLDNVLDVTLFSAPYLIETLLVLTIVSTGVILGLRTHDQPQTAPAQRVK